MKSISTRAAFRARAGLAALVLVAAAGCSSSAPTAAVAGATGSSSPAASAPSVADVASPSAVDSSAATDSPSAAASETADTSGPLSSGPTGVPTSIDPCQLFTSAEASALTGITLGPGRESTTDSNVRICTYGASTLNVFMVEVVQAPSVAVAQAAKAQAEASVKDEAASAAGAGLQLTELSGLGDGAAMLYGTKSFAGRTFAARGIYVLKGAVFFAMSDIAVGHEAPSASAMQSAAQNVLAKLP